MHVNMSISRMRITPERKTVRGAVGGVMDFILENGQPVAGGWLAYCARARDVLKDSIPNPETHDDKKSILVEGRRIASRV